MSFLANISNIIIPTLIFYIIAYGIAEKVEVYDEFIKGAKDGLKTVVGIMPTMIGLMVAVGILRASGFLDFIGKIFGQFTDRIGFPGELVPLAFIKMFSSSAATGLVLDLFKEFGTDSRIGLITSLMMSCTDDSLILGINKVYLQMQGFGVCPYIANSIYPKINLRSPAVPSWLKNE